MANQRAAKPPASKAVFVNCPFDEGFKPIFRAMIFAVTSSGYNPRCALDATDGAEIRVSKIATMIGECDYGIHDLSRVEVDVAEYRDSTCRWSWGCTPSVVCAPAYEFRQVLSTMTHRVNWRTAWSENGK